MCLSVGSQYRIILRNQIISSNSVPSLIHNTRWKKYSFCKKKGENLLDTSGHWLTNMNYRRDKQLWGFNCFNTVRIVEDVENCFQVFVSLLLTLTAFATVLLLLNTIIVFLNFCIDHSKYTRTSLSRILMGYEKFHLCNNCISFLLNLNSSKHSLSPIGSKSYLSYCITYTAG